MIPKVFISCPINKRKDYCLDEYFSRLVNYNWTDKEYFFCDNSYDKKYRFGLMEKYGFEIDYVDPREKSNVMYMCLSMNRCLDRFLKSDCDFWFINECDVMCDADVIENLYANNKMICGASYFTGTGEDNRLCEVVFERSFGDNTNRNITEIEGYKKFDGKLQQVDSVGFGAVLIHRTVLENYRFRVDNAHPKDHCDTFFYIDMYERGMKVYRDNSIIAEHKNQSWKAVTDR